MSKINLRGKIAGKFTYHKADQELRPLSLQNKDPFRKSYNTIMAVAVGVFIVGLILPKGDTAQVVTYSGIAMMTCWVFAVLGQFATNRGNDIDWKKKLLEKHKNNHLFNAKPTQHS